MTRAKRINHIVLFAEWGCMDIQNGEQAVEDDGEEDGVPDDDEGIAGMVTPKGRFPIGGKAKSYCPTSQIVRFAGEMRQLADPPVHRSNPGTKARPLMEGDIVQGGEFRKWKTSRTRITPPCLPGRFCDCLERLRIEAVEQFYIFNGEPVNVITPYESVSYRFTDIRFL